MDNSATALIISKNSRPQTIHSCGKSGEDAVISFLQIPQQSWRVIFRLIAIGPKEPFSLEYVFSTTLFLENSQEINQMF